MIFCVYWFVFRKNNVPTISLVADKTVISPNSTDPTQRQIVLTAKYTGIANANNINTNISLSISKNWDTYFKPLTGDDWSVERTLTLKDDVEISENFDTTITISYETKSASQIISVMTGIPLISLFDSFLFECGDIDGYPNSRQIAHIACNSDINSKLVDAQFVWSDLRYLSYGTDSYTYDAPNPVAGVFYVGTVTFEYTNDFPQLKNTIPTIFLNLEGYHFFEQPNYSSDVISALTEVYAQNTGGENFYNDYRYIRSDELDIESYGENLITLKVNDAATHYSLSQGNEITFTNVSWGS